MKKEKGFSLIEVLIIFVILGIIVAAFIGVITEDSYGMGNSPKKQTADFVQAEQTSTMLAEAQRQVGMPNMNNWQERKLMKMIFELRDKENIICFVYLKSDYSGKLNYIGKCIGYGIPFSAQFTNPERIAHKNTYSGGSFGTLPQADPNGLFMPTSSSATWVMMIDPDTNKPRPVYMEPEIVVSPFKLHIEN